MPRRAGFSLIELLVVVAVIAVLIGVLLPALGRARDVARIAGCLSNQRQIGAGIHAYAGDWGGVIPFGPEADASGSDIGSFYTVTGFVTSLLGTGPGRPVGLGLLLDGHLDATPEVFFCPGTDDPDQTAAQLAAVGSGQSQSSYWYRHGSNVAYDADDRGFEIVDASRIRLADLGRNGAGLPIAALAMDANFLADASLRDNFGIASITHHRAATANAVYADGSARTLDNADGRYTADATRFIQLAPRLMLRAFERADGATE